MARDRKRAKQRRDRNRRAGRAPAPAAPHLDADTEAPLEQSDPLAHGSADVDLAHAQVALGRPDEPAPGDEPELTLAEDELEAEADAATGGSDRRGRATAVHAERPGASGNRVIGFIGASWRELQRVQWPDRRQVVQATAVVLGFVIIAGAYLGLLDAVFQKVVKVII
jgi:preprotein translocase subunit SecE